MRHFYKNPETFPALGSVYEYASAEEFEAFGSPGLVPMSPAEVESHLNPSVGQPAVPNRVTMRQARLALLGAGLLDDVEAAINALPGDQGKAARIEWDYSSEVHRDKPFVIQLGTALGLNNEQLDELFVTAAGIQ